MSIILSYRCNVGVSLVVPLVVFNSTSYTQDLRFYLVQINESLTNLRIWHMTAISCQIINLKGASIYKVYCRNFLSITASKFISQRSRATCQIYRHPPVKLKLDVTGPRVTSVSDAQIPVTLLPHSFPHFQNFFLTHVEAQKKELKKIKKK